MLAAACQEGAQQHHQGAEHHQVEQIGPSAEVPGGSDVYVYAGRGAFVHRAVEEGLHVEGVVAGGKVAVRGGVGGDGDVAPVLVEVVELVGVAYLPGIGVLEHREFQGEGVAVVGKVYLGGLGDVFVEDVEFVVYVVVHVFVQHGEAAEVERGHGVAHLVHYLGMEASHSAGAAEEQLTVAVAHRRSEVELVALQAVIGVVVREHGVHGIQAAEAVGC